MDLHHKSNTWQLQDLTDVFNVSDDEGTIFGSINKDDLYNIEYWMQAVNYVVKNCKFGNFMSLLPHYDTIL